jgi:multidrug transporter EmrE-like cation transporter
METQAYLLLLVAILMGVIGQLLLKRGMSRHLGFQLRDVVVLFRDWAVMGGFGFYGFSTLLYMQVLSRLGLSVAYPTVSLGYVLVVAASRVLFKEPVSPTRWTAVGIVCIGVALVGLGTA